PIVDCQAPALPTAVVDVLPTRVQTHVHTRPVWDLSHPPVLPKQAVRAQHHVQARCVSAPENVSDVAAHCRFAPADVNAHDPRLAKAPEEATPLGRRNLLARQRLAVPVAEVAMKIAFAGDQTSDRDGAKKS